MVSPTLGSYILIKRERLLQPPQTGRVVNGRFVENPLPSLIGEHKYYQQDASVWNYLGCCPGIKLLSGSLRILLGLVDVIIGIAKVVFSRSHQSELISIGLKNIGRGCCEAIPEALAITLAIKVGVAGIILYPVLTLGHVVVLALYDKNQAKNTVIYES